MTAGREKAAPGVVNVARRVHHPCEMGMARRLRVVASWTMTMIGDRRAITAVTTVATTAVLRPRRRVGGGIAAIMMVRVVVVPVAHHRCATVMVRHLRHVVASWMTTMTDDRRAIAAVTTVATSAAHRLRHVAVGIVVPMGRRRCETAIAHPWDEAVATVARVDLHLCEMAMAHHEVGSPPMIVGLYADQIAKTVHRWGVVEANVALVAPRRCAIGMARHRRHVVASWTTTMIGDRHAIAAVTTVAMTEGHLRVVVEIAVNVVLVARLRCVTVMARHRAVKVGTIVAMTVVHHHHVGIVANVVLVAHRRCETATAHGRGHATMRVMKKMAQGRVFRC